MWPHHALRRPPIAWHARDMTGPLGMTVRQHHEASHAAYPPNARAYRGAPRVSRTAKMRDTSVGTPTSHAISSRVSFRNSGGVVPLDLSDVRICVCSPATRNACPSYCALINPRAFRSITSCAGPGMSLVVLIVGQVTMVPALLPK